MRVLWEFVGDPKPEARLHAARQMRHYGWLVVFAVTALVAIAPVMAFGVWGLVYPGLLLVLGLGSVEIYAWVLRRVYPDQRVVFDGASLHFEGAKPLIGQHLDPQPLEHIRHFSVFPVLGGGEGHGFDTTVGRRAHYNLLYFWLADGTQRAIAFKPGVYEWRKCEDPRGYAAQQGTGLAFALARLMPDRWRKPPKPAESVSDLPVDRLRLEAWGPMPPPERMTQATSKQLSGLRQRRALYLTVVSMLLIIGFVAMMVYRLQDKLS